MSPLTLGLVAVLAPLCVAAVLIALAPLRHAGRLAAWLSVGGALASASAAGTLLWRQVADPDALSLTEWRWLPEAGATLATVGVQLDGTSITMLFVVALVALCVQVFSLGYMADEQPHDLGRYFTWHALFLFSMQALVVAPNLLQLFVAWELVGLCSYLLIGFYYTKPSAARAALKAFWVTKLADLGLLIGLIVQYQAVGSFGWDPATVAKLAALGWAPAAVAALYFVAVMGKSAQFPLHVWLPDAMEGPTPVSALLHAATMVAAGVFLVVRAFPIFEAAPSVLLAMSLIGGFTAIFAAVVATTQTDIKRVLAYSTCSQLGYMVAALGAGGLFAGYFHLGTHAFFKALLFLSAGSVIHAVHSNELKDMGGLRGRMWLTTGAFVIGSAALAGIPGFAGYFSKDQVLERLFEATHAQPLYWLPFLACMATVGLTAYYMGRVVFVAFFGAPSERAKHAHEGGWSMKLPLVVLAVPAVGAGFFGGTFLALTGVEHAHFSVLHASPVGIAGIALAVGGLGVAWAVHGAGMGAGLAQAFAPVGRFVDYGAADRAWLWGYRQVVLVLATGFAWLDRYVIDGLVNAVGAGSLVLGERVRRMQTGQVSDYAYAVMVGVVGLAAWSQIVSLLGGNS